MDLWPPSLYFTEGRRFGLPDAVLSASLHQAHASQQRGFPAILSLKHLAVRTETRYEDLRRYVEREANPYRSFRIRKRSGGRRLICVPDGPLLRTQRWIARYVLNRAMPHYASAAYSPGASAVKCAAFHCGCAWLLKVDIHNYFESISEIQVYRIFKGLGYNPLVAFELARICTRVYSKTRRTSTPVWMSLEHPYAIRAYSYGQLGHLPQGAPTSPMLSNLAMKGFDADIEAQAKQVGLSYSRYADDIMFSTSDSSFTRSMAPTFLRSVYSRLEREGLRANRTKTRIAPPGTRKIVLGLFVDRNSPRLSPAFKKNLLLHAYYLKKYGPAAHASARGFRSIWSMRRHIDGLLSHCSAVEPQFAGRARLALGDVDWGPIAAGGP
jgi:RNA-directed DNA polymerase